MAKFPNPPSVAQLRSIEPVMMELPTGSLLWRIQAARHGNSPTLDFGEYAGWTIAEVAEHDPRYLAWLSRHSSGIRFRRAIEEALGSSRDLGRRAALLS